MLKNRKSTITERRDEDIALRKESLGSVAEAGRRSSAVSAVETMVKEEESIIDEEQHPRFLLKDSRSPLDLGAEFCGSSNDEAASESEEEEEEAEEDENDKEEGERDNAGETNRQEHPPALRKIERKQLTIGLTLPAVVPPANSMIKCGYLHRRSRSDKLLWYRRWFALDGSSLWWCNSRHRQKHVVQIAPTQLSSCWQRKQIFETYL